MPAAKDVHAACAHLSCVQHRINTNNGQDDYPPRYEASQPVPTMTCTLCTLDLGCRAMLFRPGLSFEVAAATFASASRSGCSRAQALFEEILGIYTSSCQSEGVWTQECLYGDKGCSTSREAAYVRPSFLWRKIQTFIQRMSRRPRLQAQQINCPSYATQSTPLLSTPLGDSCGDSTDPEVLSWVKLCRKTKPVLLVAAAAPS